MESTGEDTYLNGLMAAAMVRGYQGENNDFSNALTIHHKFTELFSLLFVDGNPEMCIRDRVTLW